jgi:hypothetical protein
MTTPDEILSMLDQPLTTDQVRRALKIYVQFTDARLNVQLQFTEAYARLCQQWGQALLGVLVQRDVLTGEDLDAIEQELAAGLAVDRALEKEDQP